jgi:hypothetical protein
MLEAGVAMPRHIVVTFLCALALVPAAARAQGLSPEARKKLLDRMNSSYYSLTDKGFKGMQCGMDVDWSAFVSNFPGAQMGPQARADMLRMFNSITATVFVDAQGHAVATMNVPDQVTTSAYGTTTNTIAGGVAGGVQSFFKSWSQFTLSKPFPVSADGVNLEPVAGGYEMTQSLDPGTVTTRFTKDFRMTDMMVKTGSMSVHSDMHFEPTPAGFLLKSTRSEIFMQPSGKMPETGMSVAYVTLDGMQLPQSLTITIGTAGPAFIKIALTACMLNK